MVNGPLIPGLREFDRPRGRWPGWLPWLLVSCAVLVVVVVVGGFVGGVGPLRSLGMSTTELQPMAYRPTSSDTVVQVGVGMPASGLCRDDVISVVAFERGNRIEVTSSVTAHRASDCAVTTIGGDLRWVDVQLDQPLGGRTLIRTIDREPLPRDSSSLG